MSENPNSHSHIVGVEEATAEANNRRLQSSHRGNMASSVLRFNGINFIVGRKKDEKRHILSEISGKVRWGRTLAIMGPSGAGKTTLISALTLDAHYGEPTGVVTLNGVTMTDAIFKKHCYVVKQHDKHWPYLTARETMRYSAKLYEVAQSDADINAIVDEIIGKLGLSSCADTRNSRLSGGQRRRLSLAAALLKQPTVLFLDEPTSGLDAAAATNIMDEIIRVAKEERLVILCTIHQPSTKVYNGFDQVMILSKGREAFAGDVHDADPYFASIGYPLPSATNPAEHFLDLVNSDFSSEEEVDSILNAWEERKGDANDSMHRKPALDGDGEEQEGVDNHGATSIANEISIMFRRHFTMIIRDPILYLGRCIVFLLADTVFAVVYWNGRENTQDQALNKFWVMIWLIGVPAQMGVVAVYALNDEFKSILRETKNGMVSPLSYVLAKSILVIPVIFIFCLFALGIPGFLIQDIPGSAFVEVLLLFAVTLYAFECVAELCAVAMDDPILGMLQFMNYWFGGFLFGGFLIPLRDMFWPFKLFYHVMPFSYFVRSMAYTLFTNVTWEPCDPTLSAVPGAICTPSSDGKDVLRMASLVFPLLGPENTVYRDIFIVLAQAVFFKILSTIAIVYLTQKVAPIKPSAGGGGIHPGGGDVVKKPPASPQPTGAYGVVTTAAAAHDDIGHSDSEEFEA